MFNAIQEYLNKNRVFEMQKVIPYIKFRFSKSSININNEGIQKILITLVKKKMIAEGTKLTKEDVLVYSRRKKIYNYVINNPGRSVYNIAKKLEISNTVVFWHLSVLIKFNFLTKRIIDNHDRYFNSNIDLKDIDKLYFTSKEKSKKIINYLNINDFGVSKTRLSKDLKIHHNTIEKYIKSLEEFNTIYKEKIAKKILYFLKETQPKKAKKSITTKKKEATLSEADKTEFKRTESELNVEKATYICIVHKGLINGTVYICPKCQSFYCDRCARALKKKNEKCWSCNREISI